MSKQTYYKLDERDGDLRVEYDSQNSGAYLHKKGSVNTYVKLELEEVRIAILLLQRILDQIEAES